VASDYILGTHAEELERLRFQHELWQPFAQEAWRRSGLKPGMRVLDLGAGPGFCGCDLAEAVGKAGRVLALERSPIYVAAAQATALERGLSQLEIRQHNLLLDPWPQERFALVWCRWVAMFLRELEPLLAGLDQCIEAGGQVIFQEYVHWDSFGLHPHGDAVGRFGVAAQRSFREGGGDHNVNRRLPSLLTARGWRIEDLRPLPVLGGQGSMAADWMKNFVLVYGMQLQQLGLWSEGDQAEALGEIDQAAADPGSFWVGPTLMELRATRLEA
jgi:SAM-dependent methyltransferase